VVGGPAGSVEDVLDVVVLPSPSTVIVVVIDSSIAVAPSSSPPPPHAAARRAKATRDARRRFGMGRHARGVNGTRVFA
jgi:hypothetical protein